jgi:hypothetical protein
VKRNVAPFYQLIVLNKMNPANHLTPVEAETEIEVSDDYLMMSDANGQIFGFWFYDDCERELIVIQLRKLVQEMAGGQQGVPAIPYNSSTNITKVLPGYYAPSPGYLQASEKERLRKALVELIQTDDDFFNRIYQVFQEEIN